MSLPDFLPPVSALPPINPAITSALATPLAALDAATPVTGFGQLISQGLDQVNTRLLASQVDTQRLAAGDVTNLHQVMLKLEESRLSFQLMLQVRNRLLESYQDVMRMQV